jgi:carboxyl-terminal processing protease
VRQIGVTAFVALCALFAVACQSSATHTPSPPAKLAAGVAVGATDFTELHMAERQLLTYAYERPAAAALLNAAWSGLVKEAAAEGIGDGTAKPPRFNGDVTIDNTNFDDAFAALKTTQPATPNVSALSGAAITTMTSSLHDTHTGYLPPETFERTTAELNGRPTSETGLRLQALGRNALLVLEVETASPAERAGVLPGDAIVGINGTSIAGYDRRARNDLVSGGQDGSKLMLDVRRPGYARVRTLTLTRQATPIDLLAIAMLPGDVGYIRLRVFASSSAVVTQIAEALARFEQQGARGVVLDLRGDPGGSVQTMVSLLSHFVGQSPLAYTKTPTRMQPVPRVTGVAATKLPFVVLVDSGSASSSEAFAQAVQDYHAGTVLGAATCGCLVGAQFYPLDGGKAGIEIGLEHVLSPVTKTDHEHNPIKPDIAVPLDPVSLRDGRDNQLEAALEQLGVPAATAQIATPVARDAG